MFQDIISEESRECTNEKRSPELENHHVAMDANTLLNLESLSPNSASSAIEISPMRNSQTSEKEQPSIKDPV